MPINIYNFGAGPATLPKTVIEKIKELQSELNLKNLLVWSNFPGVKHEDAMKSIKNRLPWPPMVRSKIISVVILSRTMTSWLMLTTPTPDLKRPGITTNASIGGGTLSQTR